MNEMERAAVSAFGLDPAKVRSGALTASATGLVLQVVIPIDADDYLAIADRMRALRAPSDPFADNLAQVRRDCGEVLAQSFGEQASGQSPTAIASRKTPL